MTLSEEALDVFRTLWAEGHSTTEIGRRLGISKNAVCGKRKRMGLPQRGNVASARPPEKCAQIDEMLRNGMPVSTIAGKVHVGHGYVMERRNELGIMAWHGATNRGRSTLPQLPSLARSAHNANPAPSQAVRDRVVKLLIDGSANIATAAAVGLSVDEIRKIRKTIVIPPRVIEPRAPRDYSSRNKEFISRERPHHVSYTAQASAFGERFQFGKQISYRKPIGRFPSSADIAAHIAVRGVTMCPTAAVALTSASIAAHDRVAISEYREARDAEREARDVPRAARSAEGIRRAAMRR